jgi:serine/threonine protein phosphatase PrpC
MSGSWIKNRIPLKYAEGFQIQGQVSVQEDYFEINPERGIFIIADGFGGGAGREAAELVTKSVRKFLEQEAGDLDATLPFELRPYYSLAGNVLFNAISYANQNLLKANEGLSYLESGGASLLAGYLEGRLLALANVGVNRLHLKRGSQVKEIVSPRSLLRQVNPMDEEGTGDQVPLMSFGTVKRLEPEISEFEVRPGDQLYFQTAGVNTTFRKTLFTLENPGHLSQIIDSAPTTGNASILWLGF